MNRLDAYHQHVCHSCQEAWFCANPSCQPHPADHCVACDLREADEWWGCTRPESRQLCLPDDGLRSES